MLLVERGRNLRATYSDCGSVLAGTTCENFINGSISFKHGVESTQPSEHCGQLVEGEKIQLKIIRWINYGSGTLLRLYV